MDEDYSQHAASTKKVGKQHNTLPIWGNEATMNLNPLILANIQGSSYFKVNLFKLKTYHEVVDEIYYQVKHMEPWERGSRKTSGQTGMCGGVRGVGAGGIVSTAYCLLYKLYTLRLTRKQVNGLLNHTDSPFIRALGFMYLRYTQPPGDLYDWYQDYLQDEEEIDVKAGGGQTITIGQMVYQFLTKLDWFSTLFPRIPVPIQKQIEKKLEMYCRENRVSLHQLSAPRSFGGVSGGGGGGSGATIPNQVTDDYELVGGSRSSRSQYPPPVSNYRSEHDDRGSSSNRRRRDRTPSPTSEYFRSKSGNGRDYERSRDYYPASSHRRHRDRTQPSPTPPDRREHTREKHKKKSTKRRHRSRSRSRSQSRERSRKYEKERSYEYDDRGGGGGSASAYRREGTSSYETRSYDERRY